MALGRLYLPITNATGDLVTGATVTVRREFGAGPAALKRDFNGAEAEDNPYVNSDGIIDLYCASGWHRIDVVKDGFTRTIRFVPVGTAQASDIESFNTTGLGFIGEAETSAPPSANSIRANNADLSAATVWWIADETLGGSDIAARLQALPPGTQLLLVDAGTDAELLARFVSATDEDGYTALTVVNPVGALTALQAGATLKLSWMPKGDAGRSAGFPLSWDNANDDSNPAAGYLKADNDALGSAAQLYVSKVDAVLEDIEAWLLSLDDSTNPDTKGRAFIARLSDGATASFHITSLVDASGYVKLNVTNHSGATGFSAEDELYFFVAPAGDAGFTPGTRLNFSTNTEATDPGDGGFKANNAAFASITALYVDNVEAHAGQSITALLDALDDVANAFARALLTFSHVDSPGTWMQFRVTGSVVDSTGFRTIAVTPHAYSGSLPANGQRMAMTVSFGGADGAGDVSAASNLGDDLPVFGDGGAKGVKTVSAATAFGAIKQAATTSATGVTELAVASEYRGNTSGNLALTPAEVWTAAADVLLTSTSNVTAVSLAAILGLAHIVLGENSTIDFTNLKEGQHFVLWFTATGSTRTLTMDAIARLWNGVEAGPYSITTSQSLFVCGFVPDGGTIVEIYNIGRRTT